MREREVGWVGERERFGGRERLGERGWVGKGVKGYGERGKWDKDSVGKGRGMAWKRVRREDMRG